MSLFALVSKSCGPTDRRRTHTQHKQDPRRQCRRRDPESPAQLSWASVSGGQSPSRHFGPRAPKLSTWFTNPPAGPCASPILLLLPLWLAGFSHLLSSPVSPPDTFPSITFSFGYLFNAIYSGLVNSKGHIVDSHWIGPGYMETSTLAFLRGSLLETFSGSCRLWEDRGKGHAGSAHDFCRKGSECAVLAEILHRGMSYAYLAIHLPQPGSWFCLPRLLPRFRLNMRLIFVVQMFWF